MRMRVFNMFAGSSIAALIAAGAASAQTAPGAAPGAQPADTVGTAQADLSQPGGSTPAASQAGPANAPVTDATENAEQDIVVTGVRASLDRAISIKRNSSGVVDAISAEDIGKFPDTNLAESLQRVTGVSIDRVNGEGSQVTVRGFGPGFNLVTLNGRTLPAASVGAIGADDNADFASGTSRSFDFANLASEGVNTLEVYKTGRAAIPSGGIGASINVVTRRPLEAREDGFSGTLGAKALYDTSADLRLDKKSSVTPEVSGLGSWSNADRTIGVSIFGSYQKRNFTTRGATVAYWNIRTYDQFRDTGNGFVNGQTRISGAPATGSTLVSVPNDSSYFYSEGTRERINGAATLQFKPMDNVTLTADALFAQNRQRDIRTNQGNWFNRPFAQVTFSPNPVVATTDFLQENIAGVKDAGFAQQDRAVKNRLQDYGGNMKWELTDRLTLSIDGHYGKSESLPDNPNGNSSNITTIAAPVVAAQSADYTGYIPVQSITINDSLRGNGNGVLDIGDVGTQQSRYIRSSQSQSLKEIRADLGWQLDDAGSRLDFGGDMRNSRMLQRSDSFQQVLGDWGVANPGDIQRVAPGALQTFCLTCQFRKFDAGATGPSLIAFRGVATDLINALSPFYAARGNQPFSTGQANNAVREKVYAVYGQLTWKGELAGRSASLVTGLRYEKTDVFSSSVVAVPSAVVWSADNDFTLTVSNQRQLVTQTGSYTNLLPSMDFQIEAAHNLIGRFSISRTIARPDFGNLFSASSVGIPPRATAVGGTAPGSTGNADLAPLISDNIDASIEWYYKPSSYVSFGVFDKRVQNFIGTGQTSQNLFGLRDPASGAAGTRSGTALAALRGIGADVSDVNLFTLTALLQQTGNIQSALQQFQANFRNGALSQTFIDQTLAASDIIANANDPLYQFSVTRPINNREGKIHGFEAAVQHFFGETGVGIAAAYTYVRGDVGVDVGADPTVDQFALLGLSDTANATLIYDKYGISARLAYNWRDRFLQATNRGVDRNPVFIAPFGQLDANISYDISPRLSISFEGINLTQSSIRAYGRDESNLWYAQELDRRFLFGIRTRF
ncbi:TonB-dependent receptor [Sphingomonas sp.]|jgi:TonB-dependent receptor|uniref:TonB-dependent receptor n=1 Tax=Sphingomonas sp. TaxID=28214 RepID=UPI0035C7DF8C